MKWAPNDEAAKFQYKDPSGQLMMLPSDIALIEDAKFKKYVDVYAKDQKKFFADFAAAFEKLRASNQRTHPAQRVRGGVRSPKPL